MNPYDFLKSFAKATSDFIPTEKTIFLKLLKLYADSVLNRFQFLDLVFDLAVSHPRLYSNVAKSLFNMSLEPPKWYFYDVNEEFYFLKNKSLDEEVFYSPSYCALPHNVRTPIFTGRRLFEEHLWNNRLLSKPHGKEYKIRPFYDASEELLHIYNERLAEFDVFINKFQTVIRSLIKKFWLVKNFKESKEGNFPSVLKKGVKKTISNKNISNIKYQNINFNNGSGSSLDLGVLETSIRFKGAINGVSVKELYFAKSFGRLCRRSEESQGLLDFSQLEIEAIRYLYREHFEKVMSTLKEGDYSKLNLVIGRISAKEEEVQKNRQSFVYSMRKGLNKIFNCSI